MSNAKNTKKQKQIINDLIRTQQFQSKLKPSYILHWTTLLNRNINVLQAINNPYQQHNTNLEHNIN